MEDTVKQRIISFMKYLGIGQKKFETTVGLSNGYINSLRKSPTAEKIQMIIGAYPELNMQWLLTGEGEMLKSQGAVDDEPETVTEVAVERKPMRKEREFRTYFKEEKVRMVPLYNIDSVGGFASGNDVIPADEQFIEDYIPFAGAWDDDVAIRESGDSMSPRIPSGAYMLIRRVVGWQEYFGLGHVYVVALKDGRRITKRVTRSDQDTARYVKCESFNPDYPPEELPRSMIAGVWKVVDVLIHEGY